MSKEIVVAVGVILRDNPLSGITEVFVTRRLAHQHQGGKWEFPGGKVEADETTERALARELAEEIGIDVHASQPLLIIAHEYPDKKVVLDVHKVSDFSGQPSGLEGQEGQWIAMSELRSLDFPEANKAILDKLYLDL